MLLHYFFSYCSTFNQSFLTRYSNERLILFFRTTEGLTLLHFLSFSIVLSYFQSFLTRYVRVQVCEYYDYNQTSDFLSTIRVLLCAVRVDPFLVETTLYFSTFRRGMFMYVNTTTTAERLIFLSWSFSLTVFVRETSPSLTVYQESSPGISSPILFLSITTRRISPQRFVATDQLASYWRNKQLAPRRCF